VVEDRNDVGKPAHTVGLLEGAFLSPVVAHESGNYKYRHHHVHIGTGNVPRKQRLALFVLATVLSAILG